MNTFNLKLLTLLFVSVTFLYFCSDKLNVFPNLMLGDSLTDSSILEFNNQPNSTIKKCQKIKNVAMVKTHKVSYSHFLYMVHI